MLSSSAGWVAPPTRPQGTDKVPSLGLTHSEAGGPDGPRSLVAFNSSLERRMKPIPTLLDEEDDVDDFFESDSIDEDLDLEEVQETMFSPQELENALDKMPAYAIERGLEAFWNYQKNRSCVRCFLGKAAGVPEGEFGEAVGTHNFYHRVRARFGMTTSEIAALTFAFDYRPTDLTEALIRRGFTVTMS